MTTFRRLRRYDALAMLRAQREELVEVRAALELERRRRIEAEERAVRMEAWIGHGFARSEAEKHAGGVM